MTRGRSTHLYLRHLLTQLSILLGIESCKFSRQLFVVNENLDCDTTLAAVCSNLSTTGGLHSLFQNLSVLIMFWLLWWEKEELY